MCRKPLHQKLVARRCRQRSGLVEPRGPRAVRGILSLREISGRRAGDGDSAILRHTLRLADERNLPVRLEYLKWNPVGNLYLRNGFVRTHETDIHIFLERPLNGTAA